MASDRHVWPLTVPKTMARLNMHVSVDFIFEFGRRQHTPTKGGWGGLSLNALAFTGVSTCLCTRYTSSYGYNCRPIASINVASLDLLQL